MSNIKIGAPGWEPEKGTQICILGDTLDLTPVDARFSYSYAVVSGPGSATFVGATLQPDVGGAWVLSVSAGADVLRLPVFVFATAVLAALSAYPTRTGTRPDAERRQILLGVARSLPTATLVAWNSGTFPPGLDSRFMQFGGGL